MDDKMIVAALGRDDEQGYSMLIDQYTAYVTAIIGGMAKGALAPADMEEVAADVFYKVWVNRARLRDTGLKALIAQITRNTTIDALRKSGTVLVAYDDDVLQVAGGERPDELAIVREQRQIIEQAVRGFGESEQEIFIRFYYFGETVKAISDKLKMNVSTIKTNLHRSRNKLKTILIERGYGRE